MVSGINSGGIPPIGVPQGPLGSNSTDRTGAASPRPEQDSIQYPAGDAGVVSRQVATLVDPSLTLKGAKKVAASLSETLRGGRLSIANGDPSKIRG